MYLKNVIYPIWSYLVYHFVTIRFVLRNVTKSNSCLVCLAILPTILLIIITSLLVFVFGFYKSFVYVCLRTWYGKKFIKFVPGCGVATSFDKTEFTHINIMARITTKVSGNELFDQINDQVFEKFFITDLRKDLFCLIRRRLGYSFMVNVLDLEIEDVFREIKTDKAQLTEDEFQVYINKYFGSPMPRNGELACDLALCTTPIEDPENPEGMNTYILLFRFAHSIGDGLVFYNLLTNAFTKPNEANEDYVNQLTKRSEKVDKLKSCPSHVVNVLEGPWYKKELIWTGNTLTSGLFVAAQRNCLWKVKEIRKCFPGLRFLNVIIAAYTASLGDYFLKYHSDDVPETITIVCPLQLDVGRIKEMLTDGGKNDFNNDFSAFQLICPILVENKTRETLIKRLMMIQEEFDMVFNSFDIQALYINFKVFVSLLPLPLVKLFFLRYFFGTMISCIPGGPKMEFFNGSAIKFPAFFLSRQHTFGIALGVLTYDDQLQVGFTLDQTKFDSKERVDMLVNGFCNYIDLIHEESVKRLDYNTISRL